MVAAFKAGIVYAIIVFAIGFVFGAIRILFVAPRLGEAIAVALEAPLMLFVSWYGSRWCIDRFNVSDALSVRIVMGLIAFAVLMAAEADLAFFVFGRSATKQLGSYVSVSGAIGLATQVAFATFPLIQAWVRND